MSEIIDCSIHRLRTNLISRFVKEVKKLQKEDPNINPKSLESYKDINKLDDLVKSVYGPDVFMDDDYHYKLPDKLDAVTKL